jgi:hypothetical protein
MKDGARWGGGSGKGRGEAARGECVPVLGMPARGGEEAARERERAGEAEAVGWRRRGGGIGAAGGWGRLLTVGPTCLARGGWGVVQLGREIVWAGC